MASINENHGKARGAVGRGATGIAFVAGLCLFSAPALAQMSLVHVTTCGAAGLPATPCTIPATAAGNLIVVAWSAAFGNIPTTTSMTDNAGNSYLQAGNARAVDAGAGQMVDIWYVKNSRSGATGVTITPSSPVTGAATVWEFSGADLADPLYQTLALNSQPGTTTPSSGAIAASSGGAIVSVMVPGGSMTGLQAGNGFVSDSLIFGVGWAHMMVPAAGTYGAQWSTSNGTYAASTVAFKAATGISTGALNACDLNSDGVVNTTDVNQAVSMALGQSACTANITGAGVCTVVTVQRVINASLPGGACVIGSVTGPPPPPPPTPSHSVTLSWTVSTSANVAGYNIYRGTTAGGPYATRVNTSPITGLTYTDTTVQAGQTYYYVAKSADASGNESGPSTEAAAVIPTP